MERYVKINTEPIEIEYVEDEHNENRDFEPSFWCNNRRYYLTDFTRIHDNPFICGDNFPDYIHGIENETYYRPLFIELINNDTAVNAYECIFENM